MIEGEMTLEIGRFTPSYPIPPASPTRATGAPAARGAVPGAVPPVPPVPPAEVRAQVDRAADIARQLAAANRELHFTKDQDTGRVVIQVRDLDGNVIRTIPPSRVLDVMSGAAL
jgi:hypothetical protein